MVHIAKKVYFGANDLKNIMLISMTFLFSTYEDVVLSVQVSSVVTF